MTERGESNALESARLQQSALARLAGIAISNSGLAFLFSRTTELVAQVLDAEIVEIHKVINGRLLAVATTSRDAAPKGWSMSFAQHAMASGADVIGERGNGERFNVPSDSEPGSVCGMSVVIDAGEGQRWGVLTLRTAQPCLMGGADADFFRALGGLLGQAIERRRTEVELRIRAVQQTAIAEIGRLTAEHLTPEALDRSCELLMEGLGLESAVVFLASGDALQVVAGAPEAGSDVQVVNRVRSAFANSAPVIFDSAASDSNGDRTDRCGIAVPISTRDGRMGAVCAYTTIAKRFTDTDLAFIQAVAYCLGDAMQRDAARAALVESERRFRSVVEGASEIIFTMTPDGTLVSLNPAFEVITGWKVEEWIGRDVFGLFLEEDRADKLALFASALREPRHIRSQARVAGRHGVVLLDVATSPKVADGKVIEFYGFARDISEEKRLQLRLEQAGRLSSLGRLAATVAHEFNNVLMGISPFTEILRRETASERATSAVDQIVRSVKRGKRITEDILRFAQPAEPMVATLEVRSWLVNLANEMRTLIGPHYNVKTTAGELHIAADPHQLHQAFMNLVLNARDAMPHGGTISIDVVEEERDARFAAPGAFAHFKVTDEGTGIAPDALEHIFEPLFTTKKTGTGLGLPVARQVVERHGGEIFVESELGRGTTFHIFIPTATAEVAETREPASGQGRRWSRVLLVEDEAAVASGITALLELEGIEVKVVGTGREVMEAIDRTRPHAVILDIGLPDIDGTAVFGLISEAHPSLPVVFSSGHADAARLERYLQQDHVGFLLKPYDIEQLLQTLDRVVARVRQVP